MKADQPAERRGKRKAPLSLPCVGMGFKKRDGTRTAGAGGLTTGAASVGVFVHERDFHVERD